jgi:succinate dehydrogenase hydrophobic anchor subunit
MPSIATWKQLNAASGLVFGGFMVLHLGCHASLNLRWELAQKNLHRARMIYQNPAFETLLIVVLMVHMASNAVLYTNREKIHKAVHRTSSGSTTSSKKEVGAKEPQGTLELKAHRAAGIVLALSIFGHVAATRVAPFFILDDPSNYDYSFVTEANRHFPSNSFSIYLMIFSVAGVWHLIYGARSALAILSGGSVHGTPFPMTLKFLSSACQLIMISAVAASTGYYYVVDMETKADLHEKLFGTIDTFVLKVYSDARKIQLPSF